MANSKGKSTNSNNKSTRSNSNTRSRTENTSKKKTEPASRKKAEPIEEEEISYASEIVIWVIGAVMLIIELGNFGLCGAVSYVSKFFFGVFGIIEYVLPVAVMFAAFFLHINEYKRRAVNKVVFGSFVLLCIGMLGQLASGIDKYDFVHMFSEGFDDQRGGGIVCGSLAYLLQTAVGQIGTYIIIIVAIIICVVLFAEVSVIDLMQGVFGTIADVHRDGCDYEEIEEEEEVERPARRRRKTTGYEEIVKEDYPERDEVFTERKKPSVLESISVLPADADQGILPSKESESLPLNEEVHEITMTYDLNLPGEHMESATDHIEDGAKAPARRRRKSAKKNVVPEVLPEREQTVQTKTQTVSQPEMSQPESSVNAKADTLAMENKTAATVENMSAKEVGNSDHTYQFPPLELLKKGKTQAAEKEDLIRQNAVKLQEVLKSLGGLEPDMRKSVGMKANEIKNLFAEKIQEREKELVATASAVKGEVDLTIPGFGVTSGALHPITQMCYDLNDAFRSLGFEIYSEDDISSEKFAFDNLNFAADHPARASMDTYWLEGTEDKNGNERLCLRPHLTGGSVRKLLKVGAPARFVYPGRVYRNETTDARHERAFFQYEALIVDKDVSFSSGRVMIETILEKVFGRKVNVRMREGFFPFTEPGYEIDMECLLCGGKGCKACNQAGWIEVMPGGVIHPNVLRAAN